MKYKVKIKKLPTAKTGQQVNYGMYNPLATMGGKDGAKPEQISVRKSIGSVPRKEANLEAEGGETVFGDITGLSIPQHYTISGPRHAQGGVPMNLPENSFIFSDFNEMKIKDPDMLAKFGKTVKKGGKGKGFTPADIAKQYDINKYIQILQDPNSDAIDRKTAQRMIENYNLKLGALALAQESKKDFEQGIPAVSEAYMEHMGITPEDLGIQENPEMTQEMMACGGSVPRRLKRQTGGPAEMMPEQMQEQDPMIQIVSAVEQMMQQGMDSAQIASELLNQGLAPEDVMQVFVQIGMPEQEASMAIEQATGQGQEAPMEQMYPEMMMQQGGQPDQLMQEVAQALQQGADPAQVMQALVQQGVPQDQAQMMIEQVMSSMQQPMARFGMEMGGYDVPFVDTPMYKEGGSPYSEAEAYTPKGVKRLNQYRAAQGLDPIDENSSKAEIKKAAGELQQKMIQDNPDLVVDYMINVSHKPNNKLIAKIPTGYPKTNEGVKKAIADGKLSSEDVRNAYKDDQWWYRALGTDAVKLTPEEYEKKQKLIEASGVKQGEYAYLYDPEQNKYIRYYTDKEGNPTTPATKITPEEKKPQEEGERPDMVNIPDVPQQGIVPAEWTTPDIMNYYGALRDRYTINKYMPWAAKYSPEVPEAVFTDPTRELAAQSEQANILTQGLGQFVGPQAFSARASSIQGQGAKQAADTLSRYNQQNVGIANQFAGTASNIRNQAQQYNLGVAKQLYDQGVISNQQYDNAERQARAEMRKSFGQGWKNASDIAMLNATSDQYNIDPATGTVYFDKGKLLEGNKEKTVNDLIEANKAKGMSWEEAIKAAKLAMGTPQYAQEGGYVLGANVFPFMFY
jgi:SOS response regulatory protein OraA/RecX